MALNPRERDILRDSITIRTKTGLVTLTLSKKLTFLNLIFSNVIGQTVTLTLKANLINPSNQKMQTVLSRKIRKQHSIFEW